MRKLWYGVGPCLTLHRADLQLALLAGIDVPVGYGQTPHSVLPDHIGVVVQLEDGHTDRYDLVLGADGVHATVRRLVFDGHRARPVGQRAWRFVAPWSDPDPLWSVQLGRGSAFLTISVGDGRVYCYCDGPLDYSPPLRELLSGYFESVPTLLDAFDGADVRHTLHTGAVEEVVLDSWSRGAVLLIGDTAHATSPNMAQGAAMAIEDALVLVESLAPAATIAEALSVFECRRRRRTDWVVAQTQRRDRARSLPPRLRSVVLRRFGKRMFHANYRPLREPS